MQDRPTSLPAIRERLHTGTSTGKVRTLREGVVMTINEEAVKAGAAAIHNEISDWYPLEGVPDLDAHAKELARKALEAAAPHIQAATLEALTTNSPRLPNDVRGIVFEAVFDVVDKFNFPCQNMGPYPDLVEIGDVCGDVEKRIVAILRARAAAVRGGE